MVWQKSNRNLEETDLFSDSTDGRVKELLEELEEKNLKIQCMTEQLKKNEVQNHYKSLFIIKRLIHFEISVSICLNIND